MSERERMSRRRTVVVVVVAAILLMVMMIKETDDVLREACDLLYPFMHPPSLVSKYSQRYRQNGLQATARCSPPGSILLPTKDRSCTPRHSHTACAIMSST